MGPLSGAAVAPQARRRHSPAEPAAISLTKARRENPPGR
ncbi:MAG: hypothetical protein MOGDAGHF_01550 [Rhodocyclaceae bacterium]|nr:hypothetical protein [Rhodocyclaceae bacterium]